jgi:hypothetical protein
MDGDATPATRPPSPKPEQVTPPTEAELSRIAREAVRQPADPRIDRQLEWMGLTEPSEPAEREQRTPRVASDQVRQEIERLDRRVRRVEVIVGVLVVAVAILALAAVVILVR